MIWMPSSWPLKAWRAAMRAQVAVARLEGGAEIGVGDDDGVLAVDGAAGRHGDGDDVALEGHAGGELGGAAGIDGGGPTRHSR
ncbi:MAG: hypothetical protein U0841_15995 [Chloroflexia bacterium]